MVTQISKVKGGFVVQTQGQITVFLTLGEVLDFLQEFYTEKEVSF